MVRISSKYILADGFVILVPGLISTIRTAICHLVIKIILDTFLSVHGTSNQCLTAQKGQTTWRVLLVMSHSECGSTRSGLAVSLRTFSSANSNGLEMKLFSLQLSYMMHNNYVSPNYVTLDKNHRPSNHKLYSMKIGMIPRDFLPLVFHLL